MQLTKKEVKNPRDNEVYKRALKFRKEIYAMVKGFPELEKYNMIDQLQRASTSVPANFSEGYRNHYYGKERDRLNTALGSIAECQAFLDMARMEDYITQEQYLNLDNDAEVIFGMLLAMIRDIDRILEQHDLGEEE
ncbi:four helix bundle protein [Heyndrickxia sporothermodurans]|uniref:Four helix bundle protein n=1 Tax=Heyndrickxia sporothermodurans TaxID=46224 RepID=A0AB37HEB5_9BACI|nr:four helix bundle protein [Heyndrickxia sporothermodurans]MBL5768651.1 four helix bundle protein [Heyndrickxia sporothermodurans]MBL5772287.1 four helix bundle protein [Heyndrickxia sporothermodurans]MBL5775838.1 four helix bundle protein [Heyndrickxia sporothermodurans]MBL5779370.1 four helix bundle protein [Heyndrickxia sporothermodurans]MBL5782444.1 four helix bundle protein [Heyndrickxia sporothermodurans]